MVACKQDVCEYLLDQTTWPDLSSIVARYIAPMSWFTNHNKKKKKEMFEFLVGQSELDIHAEPSVRSFWANSCSDGKLLNAVLKNQYPGFETSPVESRFELASRLLHLSINDFLNCVGLRPWDQRLATLKNSNGLSTLDYVARKLILIPLGNLSKCELVGWMNLGVSVLKNGADPCNLTDKKDIDWFKNGYDLTETQMTESGQRSLDRRRTTPLLKCVGPRWPAIGGGRKMLEASLVSLRTWVGMIRDAGIDLLDYGGREKRAWDFLKAQNNEHHHYLELTDLIIGPTPASWGLKVRCKAYCPVYALQQIPGSYPAEPRLPHLIAWHPTEKEEPEGCWLQVTHKTFFSQAKDIEEILASEPAMFTNLIDEVQDDLGSIMLMQYRATRMHSTKPRSCSQPPSLRRREFGHYSVYKSHRRPWLPEYHLCPSDFRWQFNCCPRISLEGTEEFQLRDCITGNGRFRSSVQESVKWRYHSFLEEIVRCQDSHTYEPYERSDKRYGHTGSLSCPEGCANIHIDQLAVPKAMQPFHPTRQHENGYDEVDESDDGA